MFRCCLLTISGRLIELLSAKRAQVNAQRVIHGKPSALYTPTHPAIALQADPTKLELMYKDYEVKKDKFKDTQRESILAKYGGEEHLKVCKGSRM